jgi:hypothetical protein
MASFSSGTIVEVERELETPPHPSPEAATPPSVSLQDARPTVTRPASCIHGGNAFTYSSPRPRSSRTPQPINLPFGFPQMPGARIKSV